MRHAIQNAFQSLKLSLVLFFFCSVPVGIAAATEWSGPAQQLAQKIVAVTGPGAVAVTVENRSSLWTKNVDAISGELRVDLEALGVRPAKPEQAAASAAVSLSENAQSCVWVAEIHQGAGASAVVMVSVPRGDNAGFAHESMPVSLRKIPLWAQEDRILDVLILEEDSAPRQIAVLDGEKVSIYRLKNGKWELDQRLGITHARPWPRDLRGRVMEAAAKDHLLDVYLPGVFCRSTASLPLTLNCRESDDPWPLVATAAASFPSFGGGPSVQPLGGFYSATRNFFTGALAPGVGKLSTVGKFYSAAALPREKYLLWLFAGTDGQIHLVDGVTDQAAKLGWGSDVASVKTACGSGWQALATGAGENAGNSGADSVRAYEIADRAPVPVSAALDFPGEITALWTEAKGDSAVAVVRNRETGAYEAFRLAAACSQ
ncbi:MAG: hypothetical protein WBW24_01720 [Candidatus Sulfotelmatobacter sp.]